MKSPGAASRRFGKVLSRLRSRMARSITSGPVADSSVERILALCDALLADHGGASVAGLAADILHAYDGMTAEARVRFLTQLASGYGPDPDRLEAAIQVYLKDRDQAAATALHAASEPRRQQLIRMLNLPPGGIAMLLRLRRDALAAQASIDDFAALDADFRHLFSSWFNGGFLVLKRIEWSSPGAVLAKIIDYEAVHQIASWDELRRRIEPADRRCYAFFHPKLPDEPLIFVEIALTDAIPASIDALLMADRAPLSGDQATTAVFYSISNCQDGLRGVPFGGFLIKRVVELLKVELPSLKTFVTLSPVPGFAKWLARQRAVSKDGALTPDEHETLSGLDDPAWPAKATEALREALLGTVARYLVDGRTDSGAPIDSVARFHIGNGARLEQVNWMADRSSKGLSQSHGILVNYLYDLRYIERNYRAHCEHGEVPASPAVLKLSRVATARRQILAFRKARPESVLG
jgi:malonyl-CoA decarboxylase